MARLGERGDACSVLLTLHLCNWSHCGHLSIMFLRHEIVLFLLAISLFFCLCDAANELLQRPSDMGNNAHGRTHMDKDLTKEIHAKICTMVRDGNLQALEEILNEYNVKLNEIICLQYFPVYQKVSDWISLNETALCCADVCISLDFLGHPLSHYGSGCKTWKCWYCDTFHQQPRFFGDFQRGMFPQRDILLESSNLSIWSFAFLVWSNALTFGRL